MEFYQKAPGVINCDFGEGGHGRLWRFDDDPSMKPLRSKWRQTRSVW